jgi:hypothetical protein
LTQRGVSQILFPTSAMQNAVHVGTKLGTSLARSLSWSRTRIRALAVRVRESWRYAPRLREQPEALGRLLLDARRAQITLGVLFVLGLVVMPSVRDAVLELVLPPEMSSGFLGFGRKARAHPDFETWRTILTYGYWLAAIVASGVLLCLDLPRAFGEAHEGENEAGLPTDRASGTEMALGATVVGTCAVAAVPSTTPTAEQAPAGGRYIVEAALGQGGMGSVYRARDRVLGRTVALKQLFPELVANRELAQRFEQEARVLAQLAHSHIVQIFDLVVEPSGMWMAMELIDGGSLEDKIERDGALPLTEALRLARQMAEALAYAHAQGVVHRDFKPGNVMLTPSGHVKVADFGLAKLLQHQGDAKLTRAGTVMGSPPYMSPEQATAGAVDVRTDIYAFGITLFEMLTGSVPFTGELTHVLMGHLTRRPEFPAAIAAKLPEPLVALVLHTLEKRPEDRPASMADVLERLASA